jgi:DNA-binding CsgD family transcriptional regulator
MNHKAYTQSQQNSSCEAAIFELGNKINKGLTIADIGDYIPGSIMVQDMSSMTNLYMNKNGCDILQHSSEELKELGPAYFNLFFPPEEIAVLKLGLIEFLKQNDSSKVYSFFQRVRPNPNTNYKWYLTSSRIYPNYTNETNLKVMHIAIEIGNTYYAAKKMNDLCEHNELIQKYYAKYNLLTCREKEIIKLVADGKSSYAISDMLFISQHTVNNHRKNILHKLKVKSLSELIKFAFAFNIL